MRRTKSNLDKKVKTVFNEHRGRYGAPRITKDLKAEGELCSQNSVAKRMKHLGLCAKGKKRFKATTDSNHKLPVAENILNRDFITTRPNQKWVGDISYIWTDEGYMYLAVIIDLYSRTIIGWSMADNMSRQLVCNALIMALWRRGFPRGVVCHSDRGAQYCSNDYQAILKKYGVICSMSRKGNCWDNAVAESFFHTLKTELVYLEKYATRKQAKESIFHYIEIYYNRIRRHSVLGFVAPVVFEQKAA